MKRWPIFFLLILVFALHFFRLSDIPPGLSNDEAANGYEAYSLYRTGADQWGNRFPLVLHGFGDDRLPMYSYLSIPFVAVFGLNAMAVRLLSVVSGIGLVFAMYLLELLTQWMLQSVCLKLRLIFFIAFILCRH